MRMAMTVSASDRERLLLVEARAGAKHFGNHQDDETVDERPETDVRRGVEADTLDRDVTGRVEILGPDEHRPGELASDDRKAHAADMSAVRRIERVAVNQRP